MTLADPSPYPPSMEFSIIDFFYFFEPFPYLNMYIIISRRAALDWIRANGESDGVIYFADDDNSYDVRQCQCCHEY